MTRLNRVYNRRILLYIGNKEGLISYAIGRGPLYEDAYINAYKELRKNLIVINLDKEMSCPSNLNARFNDYRIKIFSAYNPSYWGSPLMCLILRYTGLYHVMFSLISRKKDPYAMIFAFFKAVTRNKTPRQMLEASSTKNYREFVGRPRRYDYNVITGDNKV
jgi:ribosomal protein S5